MSQSLPAPERPWRLYITAGVVLLLIVLTIIFARRNEEIGDEPDENVNAEAVQLRNCEIQLAGILAAVDPRELGLSSNQTDRAHDLNLWQADCGALYSASRIAEDEELVDRLLPTEMAALVKRETFAPRDAAHLRTTVLLRQLSQHIVAGQNDPLRQAVLLFQFVQRNVLDMGPNSPTMTPYEALLLGRASAAHRAWVFAELLRQIELDAVIVQPANAPAGDSDRWLVGVPVTRDGQSDLYLFDPLIGLPIPAASEQTATTPVVEQPATLKEVRAAGDLLRQLDIPGTPYRFAENDLQEVRIGLIGNSSLWSNRIASLDYATEHRGAIFYDGLGKNRLREASLYDRVAKAGETGGWTKTDLFIWSFPEAELSKFGTPEANGQALIANFNAVLAGPLVLDITDPMTGRKLVWSHPLIRGRHYQVTGVFQEATREYNAIRSGLSVFQIDPRNDLCRESAVYWTTVCQYEQGEFVSVINTSLRGHYPPGFTTNVAPIWIDGMGTLAAHSLAQVKEYTEAVNLLSQLQPAVKHGHDYLLRRWKRIANPEAPQPMSEPTTETAPQPATATPPQPETSPAPTVDQPTEPAPAGATSPAAVEPAAASETPPAEPAAAPEPMTENSQDR